MTKDIKTTIRSTNEIELRLNTEWALGLVEQISVSDPVAGTPAAKLRDELCKALTFMGFEHQGC